MLAVKALQRFGRFLPSRAGGGGPLWRREVIEAILRQVEECVEIQGGMVPASGALLVGLAPPLTEFAPEDIAQLLGGGRCTGHFGVVVGFQVPQDHPGGTGTFAYPVAAPDADFGPRRA